jgi:hypothetical protein
MTHKEIADRLDQALAALPADRTAMSIAIRYDGILLLQEKISTAVDVLQKLKTDLEGENENA